MKSVPSIVLSCLLLALCGLCGWQWHRESQLRALLSGEMAKVHTLTAERDDLLGRVKAADAEVLRLTASLSDLRANSVSKEVHAETQTANTTLKEAVTKQNVAITQQNETLAKQNAAIIKANDNIKAVVAERDALAKKLNEVTAMYNELVKQGKK